MLSTMAGDIGTGYAQMGATQGQGLLAQAQYNASKPDPFGQFLGAAWMLGGGMNQGGGGGSYNPYAIATGISNAAGYGALTGYPTAFAA